MLALTTGSGACPICFVQNQINRRRVRTLQGIERKNEVIHRRVALVFGQNTVLRGIESKTGRIDLLNP
jgi:hypothetical protein